MASPLFRRLQAAFFLLLFALLLVGAWLVARPGMEEPPVPPDAPVPEATTARTDRPHPAPATPRGRVQTESATREPGASAPESPAVPEVPAHSPVAPTRTVRVLVVNESGIPVRDAHVTAFSMFGNVGVKPVDATTDVEGRTTLTIAGTANMTVRAWTADAAALGDRISVTPDADVDVTLTLRPGVRVAGRVESEDGTPVADASLVLNLPTDDPFGLRLTTDSDDVGRFDLGVQPVALLTDATTRLVVAARGHVRLNAVLTELGDPPRLVVRLTRGQVVRGRCVAVGAAPVGGVRVRLVGGEAVASADDGTFELLGVGRDGGVLDLWPPRHVVPPLIEILPGTGEVDLGDILLAEGRPVSGVVVDEQDRPVSQANVSAFEQDGLRFVRENTTDREGRFTLRHLGDAPHALVAKGSQGEWSAQAVGRATDVIAGTTGLRIVLSGGLSLLVSFKSSADGSDVKVASAEVEVTRTDVDTEKTVSAWAGPGMTSVRVTFESAGRYRVVVKVPGYEPATVEDVEILEDRGARIDALFRQLPQ